jgi:hypothetical protein
VGLFIATIVYAVLGIIAIWWAIFAGSPGLRMGVYIVFIVGAVALAVAAKVLSARQRY